MSTICRSDYRNPKMYRNSARAIYVAKANIRLRYLAKINVYVKKITLIVYAKRVHSPPLDKCPLAKVCAARWLFNIPSEYKHLISQRIIASCTPKAHVRRGDNPASEIFHKEMKTIRWKYIYSPLILCHCKLISDLGPRPNHLVMYALKKTKIRPVERSVRP